MSRKQTLTHNQHDFLMYLRFGRWKEPPLCTRAATVLSLQQRGYIKMHRPERSFCPRYSEMECQITDEGRAALKALKVKQEGYSRLP